MLANISQNYKRFLKIKFFLTFITKINTKINTLPLNFYNFIIAY